MYTLFGSCFYLLKLYDIIFIFLLCKCKRRDVLSSWADITWETRLMWKAKKKVEVEKGQEAKKGWEGNKKLEAENGWKAKKKVEVEEN